MKNELLNLLTEILIELRHIRMVLENAPKSKDKKSSTMMNDVIRNTASEGKASSEATAFAVRLEKIYRRTGNGGYDWKGANNAAMNFLSKHSLDDRNRLLKFVNEHHSSLVGKLPIYPGMFDELWDFMIRKDG